MPLYTSWRCDYKPVRWMLRQNMAPHNVMRRSKTRLTPQLQKHRLSSFLLHRAELELDLIQTQMTQKPMLRAEVGMRVRCTNKASAERFRRERGIGQIPRKICKKRGICVHRANYGSRRRMVRLPAVYHR